MESFFGIAYEVCCFFNTMAFSALCSFGLGFVGYTLLFGPPEWLKID